MGSGSGSGASSGTGETATATATTAVTPACLRRRMPLRRPTGGSSGGSVSGCGGGGGYTSSSFGDADGDLTGGRATATQQPPPPPPPSHHQHHQYHQQPHLASNPHHHAPPLSTTSTISAGAVNVNVNNNIYASTTITTATTAQTAQTALSNHHSGATLLGNNVGAFGVQPAGAAGANAAAIAQSQTLCGATTTSTLGGRAMRYYRLWIYTCNTALLAGALAFMGAAARTLLFDYRRLLIPSLSLYQPSFLYAYLALATQGGALQLLGCVAAVRLSERLLNAYWVLLLVLLFGDLVIGAFWAFRFERVCEELKPVLRQRWRAEYGTNSDMTRLWDQLQLENSCCGVYGPMDYSNESGKFDMPPSCCAEQPNAVVAAVAASAAASLAAATTATTAVSENTTSAGPSSCKMHAADCGEKLVTYLRTTASVLAILGYCVLAFLKLCFLGILRYEIREMIQKIRILRAELELVPAGINGGVPVESAESERESLLLVRPDSALLLSSPPQPAHYQHQQHQQHQSQPPSAAHAHIQPSHQQLQYEHLKLEQQQLQQQQQQQQLQQQQLQQQQQLLALGSIGANAKNPNGNNNYEMREYHRSSENI